MRAAWLPVAKVLTAAAVVCLVTTAGPARADDGAGANLRPGAASISEGVSIGRARLLDHAVGRTGRRAIDAFLFEAGAGAPFPAGQAVLTVTSGDGAARTYRTPLAGGPAGREIRVPAGLEVSREMEGPFSARLTIAAAGRDLFDGDFSFGYPRYKSTRDLRRARTSAMRDDFDAPAIDTDRWRIWISDPGKARVEQHGGRLWITATGPVGYNGLSARARLPLRDVAAVCRAGFASAGAAPHAAIVHLCGSGPFSPDHWFEVQLRNGPGGQTSAIAVVSAPAPKADLYRGPYQLPGPGTQDHLVRLECEAASRTCAGFVEVSGDWWRIGDAFEVPARESHLEVKTAGGAPGGGSTTTWFDDCRTYPRPETHDVGVVLKRADGSAPGSAGEDPICFDEGNEPIGGCGLRVQLLTADGAALVDETTVGKSFGFAMLRPGRAPFTAYPVAARIRVLAGDRPIGPDHIIRSEGVEGLYPDDVYELTIE